MLSKAQRIVVVVALGLALWAVGSYLAGLGQGGAAGLAQGWAMPFTAGGGFAPASPHPWVSLIIWLVLVGVWALASIRVLRPSSEKTEQR
jgi:hypothetical protein